jgi:hypothetical protein
MIEYILFACSFFLTLPSALDTNYLTVATDFLAWRRRIRQLHIIEKRIKKQDEINIKRISYLAPLL